MSGRTNQRTVQAGEGRYLAGVGLAPYPSSRTQADIKLQQNWCPACAPRQIEGFHTSNWLFTKPKRVSADDADWEALADKKRKRDDMAKEKKRIDEENLIAQLTASTETSRKLEEEKERERREKEIRDQPERDKKDREICKKRFGFVE